MDGQSAASWFPAEEREGLELFWKACASGYTAVNRQSRAYLIEHALVEAIGPQPSEGEASARDAQMSAFMQHAVATGDFSKLSRYFSAIGERWSRAGIEMHHWYRLSELFRTHMLSILFDYYRGDQTSLYKAIVALQRYNDNTNRVILHEYIRERERLLQLQKRSAQELEAENLRMAEASRLKDEFLANMSHELRTPLNSIIGFSQLLHDGEVPSDAPQYREFLSDILRSGRHLLQLINAVLDLAKVESGKMDFHPEPLAVPTLVQEVCSVVRTLADNRKINLTTHIEAGLQVTLDPLRLKQVLYNYLSNALKFTPDGGSVQIEVRGQGKDAVRLSVRDTGIGIATQDLGRLFTEFQQLANPHTKRHPGTGLGLALTKRIVEAQGGMVGVHSELGKGSEFFAVLPRKMAAAPSPSQRPLRNDTQELCVQRELVLVLDGDEAACKLLELTLHKLGFATWCTSEATAALAWAKQNRPLAIVLDLVTTTGDPLAFLEALRNSPETDALPVLIWTVKDLNTVERARLFALVHGVFVKGGGRPDDLLGALAELSQQRPR